MTILMILIFAVVILTAGVMILINPEMVFSHMRKNAKKARLQILAVVVRMVFGALLIYHAGESKFPLTMEIIGWVSLVAAIGLVLVGPHRFSRLMLWALSHVKRYGRVAGAVAVSFGVFLIYAFI